jgi:hypothetical protein
MRKVGFGALLALCLVVAADHGRSVPAAVLLEYGTNRGRVMEMEMNYVPDGSQLAIAVTLAGGAVKRAEYRGDGTIQNILLLLRHKERGRLFVTYELNRVLSFYVLD